MHSASDSDIQADNTLVRRQIVRRILSVLLIAVLLLIGSFIIRISFQGWTMYQSATRILDLVRSDRSETQLPILSDEIQKIATAVEAIDNQFRPISPLLNMMDGITTFGSTVAAIPELLSAGSTMANVGSDALILLIPGILNSDNDARLAQLTDALAASGDDLSQLVPDAEAASILLNSIDTSGLPPSISERIGDVQTLGRLLPAGLSLAPQASSLLGFDGPKTYLLLVHNNHELRATGGFISAVGRLRIEDAQITEMDFVDSYEIYQRDGEYPPAPQPMQQYMNIPVMLFRDTNWSPDFPKSAELARSFYLQETGIDVDGVISIDMYAVEKLVHALGPLQIAGADQAVTGGNIVDFIKEVWARPLEAEVEVEPKANSDWWSQRKEFMPALAGAALQKLESGDVNYPALAEAALVSLDQRSVQVWLSNAEAAPLFSELGWDGALHPSENADFLALIDTNMGYNKVNSVIQPTIRYDVTWPNGDDKPAIATTTIDYLHPVESPDHVCNQSPRYGDSYDDMIERCYYDFVRLYVPAGSKLLDTEGLELDSVTSRRGENGTQVFTGWFVLPPGEKHSVSFSYELPPTITQDSYQLVVQRQSGTAGLPLKAKAGDKVVETVVESGRFEWQPAQ
jgi:hypothetical protein